MPGPRLIVDAPALTPTLYSLLSVAQPRPTADPHWQNGVTFEVNCASPALTGYTTYDECVSVTGTGATPPSPSLALNTVKGLRGATPFTVYAQFDCSAVGNEEAAKFAAAALAQVEDWQVERAFWTGQAGGQTVVWPHLSYAPAVALLDAQGVLLQPPVVTGGGAFKPARALAVLEGLLGDCYGNQGVIHVPASILSVYATAPGAVLRVGAHMQTMKGNLVAVGDGYPGTSPSGAAPAAGTAWIYATGAVGVWRGDVRLPPQGATSFDRAENTLRMIAERTYVLGWDCCLFGVLVDLT